MSKKPSILDSTAKGAKDTVSLLGKKAKESGLDEKAKETKDKASLLGKKAKDTVLKTSLFNKKHSE